jgi:Melibiase/Glycosyl hydrolase family 36 C-terminal domain
MFIPRHGILVLAISKLTSFLRIRVTRLLPLEIVFLLLGINFSGAQVSITKSSAGWKATNGNIYVELVRSSGTVQLRSLRREGGSEWAVSGSPLVTFPDKSSSDYQFLDDTVSGVPKDGQQLTLRFKSGSGGIFSLMLTLYPTNAVLEMRAKLENVGQKPLLLDSHIDPLSLVLKDPPSDLKAYSSAQGEFGFQSVGSLSTVREFHDWVVLENNGSGESALIGGEPGLGVLGWKATTQPSGSGLSVQAGTVLLKEKRDAPAPVFELAPGGSVETPLTFLVLAKGDTDVVGNEAFRYLKKYIFLTPLPDAPFATYCIWLTQKNSEVLLLRELDLAQRVGFDVFYHDATWNEGASFVPGMNDWTLGLGNYNENKEKFPHGLANLSDQVHARGMKFGLWVDPGNVDAALVESGQIPKDWLAEIDGKPLGERHPSLTPTKQLCLGNPQVVAWIKKQLADLIEKYNLDWIKWDPSATVSYECNRTDHGHGKTDGAYAAYRGRQEVMRYLMERFPKLSGFECDPSLLYARVNPGPQGLLPGGYTNEFITGPMVSPNVWGSLASAGVGDAKGDSLTARWYSASSLDYYLRKHFIHGISFGNINGMSAQFLSAAPAGYIEAFQRNLLYFKEYRHLLFEDVYHLKPQAAGWSSIQYVKENSTESVVFIFRDKSEAADTTIALRGLDSKTKYRVTSLNDRPGRERIFTGEALANGISEHLPNEWLAKGDASLMNSEFADQLNYGSDILLLKRLD